MTRFSGRSAVFQIIVSFLLLCSLLGGIKGQLGMNDVNLQEDVAQPTESSCEERKRRSAKRSVNESSHDTPPPFDDCMAYSSTCPDHVRISWLHAAPFLYDANGNSNKSKKHISNMKGIFHDVVTRAIGACCKIFAGKIPQIRFLEKAPNLMALRHKLLHRSADMIIPVHNDEEKYGGNVPYIKILDSPGVILIAPHSSIVKKWNLVFNAVFGTWPVVLMAFLMSSVAGVFIWVLVSAGWEIIDFLWNVVEGSNCSLFFLSSSFSFFFFFFKF